MLRGKTISYSTFKKKERENIEFELESKLTILYQNGGTHEEEISKLESELKNIREEKVKGIIIRAKAKWNIEGERSTRYFCNLEKRHYTVKIIPKLILEDNTEVTHQKDILVQQKLFYQTLYESRGTIFTDEHLKSFFDDNNPYISKLGQDKKLNLEGELTPQETLFALKLMKNGKSPGMNGFTTEFYKFFWIRSFNHGYEKGHLSVTQRQGVITCLPKEGKSKFYIKNWRPISLFNVDYKICSSSMEQRLKKKSCIQLLVKHK
jgi:hypothetical protein